MIQTLNTVEHIVLCTFSKLPFYHSRKHEGLLASKSDERWADADTEMATNSFSIVGRDRRSAHETPLVMYLTHNTDLVF